MRGKQGPYIYRYSVWTRRTRGGEREGEMDRAGKCCGTIEFATHSVYGTLDTRLCVSLSLYLLSIPLFPYFFHPFAVFSSSRLIPACPSSPQFPSRFSFRSRGKLRGHYVQLQEAFSRSNSGWRSFDHDPEERLGSIRTTSAYPARFPLPPLLPSRKFVFAVRIASWLRSLAREIPSATSLSSFLSF